MPHYGTLLEKREKGSPVSLALAESNGGLADGEATRPRRSNSVPWSYLHGL